MKRYSIYPYGVVLLVFYCTVGHSYEYFAVTRLAKVIRNSKSEIMLCFADKSILDQAIEGIDFMGDFPEVSVNTFAIIAWSRNRRSFYTKNRAVKVSLKTAHVAYHHSHYIIVILYVNI